jgi:hypothetical protein
VTVDRTRVTRRTLLAGALGAAVAAPVLRAAGGTPAAPAIGVGDAIARGVALGPGGVGDEQRYGSNRRYFGETGCAWVRLWAEWPKLQPAPDLPPDFGVLDAEIAAARGDGLKVMLTSWRFPGWANGTAGLAPEPEDPTFVVPKDLGEGGPFARWIEALGRRDVDAIEIVNEPNHQMLPQLGLPAAVARMLATSRAVLGRRPLLVAPAMADRRGTSAIDTDHLEFAEALLDELDAIGFRPDDRTAWSHHNYGDVESDSSERIAAARDVVARRWPAVPFLVTESGARLSVIARKEGIADPLILRRRQADLIARGYERLRLGPEGAGVGVVMQYLFITDPNYDSGLCDLDGRPRPAYHAWAELRTLR